MTSLPPLHQATHTVQVHTHTHTHTHTLSLATHKEYFSLLFTEECDDNKEIESCMIEIYPTAERGLHLFRSLPLLSFFAAHIKIMSEPRWRWFIFSTGAEGHTHTHTHTHTHSLNERETKKQRPSMFLHTAACLVALRQSEMPERKSLSL